MVQVEEQIGRNFEESVDKFVQKIDIVRRRAADLQQCAGELSLPQLDMTPAALEELETALYHFIKYPLQIELE